MFVFLRSCSGLPVVSVGTSDWCAVRHLGQEVLPPHDGLLHLRPHPFHEDQPVVSHSVCLTSFNLLNVLFCLSISY